MMRKGGRQGDFREEEEAQGGNQGSRRKAQSEEGPAEQGGKQDKEDDWRKRGKAGERMEGKQKIPMMEEERKEEKMGLQPRCEKAKLRHPPLIGRRQSR